jgi:hypothetical protein
LLTRREYKKTGRTFAHNLRRLAEFLRHSIACAAERACQLPGGAGRPVSAGKRLDRRMRSGGFTSAATQEVLDALRADIIVGIRIPENGA